MVQMLLFPKEFPELELCPTNLTEEEVSILEKIAREVADNRLTFEDTHIFPLVRTKYADSKKRLETMLRYIHKKQDGIYHYLVKNNLSIVGYVGI